MAAGSNAQTIASQLEYVRPELEESFLVSSKLWSRIQQRTDIKPVSSRPSRIPFTPIQAGDFGQMDPDGGGLGVGNAPIEVPGTLSCVYFRQGGAYTAQSDWATDSDEKAIKRFVAYTQDMVSRTFAGFMDAVAQGDGSNTLDTIVTVGANYLVVNNANFFQSQQKIDIYSALTGSAGFVATVQIQTVDIANNTLWLTAAVPGGVAQNYFLLVTGSAGLANTGLFGLRYYQQGGNAGNYMNILRSTFPGMFSTPYIPANGALTPSIVRAMLGQIILAKGEDEAEESDLVVHMNVDMEAAWENNALLVQRVDIEGGKRGESADMLAKRASGTVAGYEKLLNPRALPGLIDFLALKHWFRLEAKSLDLYDVDGQTVFPAYAADGSVATKSMFWLVMGCQIGNGQPRLGAYIPNVTIPRFFFGR
jgi:hypothetical protein